MFNSSVINDANINGESVAPVGSVIIDAYPDAKVAYSCQLGDLTLPMSFFSMRLVESVGIYLTVTIPAIVPYIELIEAREADNITITQTKSVSGVIVEQNPWASVAFEQFSYLRGARSQSGTLEGRGVLPPSTPKEITLNDVSMEGVQAGRNRIRASPDTGVSPGDTVVGSNLVFIASEVTISVSVQLSSMDIRS